MSTASSADASSHDICEYCKGPLQLNCTNCPHCGRPMLFPNVRIATQPPEKKKLKERFLAALSDAKQRGCEQQLEAFVKTCKSTKAVLNRTLERLHRWTTTGTDIFETYYDVERLRIRSEIPSEPNWEKLRPQAEIELLGSDHHKDCLHYALLSIEGNGLATYGVCTLVLKESMIAHRSSCFEENSGVYWYKHKEFPLGKRSDWENRHKLCAAKLSDQVNNATQAADFSGILLSKGQTPLDDNFIEVQVFGPMTSRTVQSVTVDMKKLHCKKTFWKAVKYKLEEAGVTVIEK